MDELHKNNEYDQTKIKIMLIGFGPHSKRIYFPLIEKFSKERNIELVLAVDLTEKNDEIRNYLSLRNSAVNLFLIPPHLQTTEILDNQVERILDEIVKREKIDGVIIATEPLCHVMYAKWALKNNLHILMDKPVSTHQNISTDENLAKKLITDYDELSNEYNNAIGRNQSITFSLMAQRRFHPAFQKIKDLIRDCAKKTNCPITSIQTFHCDGQWRMPTEIVEQLYHPYKQGYGKCSHSGYHFFDIVPFLLEAGVNNEKNYDNIEVFTNFVKPLDFMEQLKLEDYEGIFGKENFWKHNKYTQSELTSLMRNFGEIDAFSNIAFKKGDKIITNATINLAHNGFGQRNWVTAANRDLYKGNGRIRHEFHIIEQGPFQSIHYHSYQSQEVDPSKKNELYAVGGEYHLDIYVFRNSNLLGGKSVEVFRINDLNVNIMEGRSRGHQEDARAKGFLEFIDAMKGKLSRCEMTSDFFTHRAGVLLTSAVYQSAAARVNHKNPLINIKYTFGPEAPEKISPDVLKYPYENSEVDYQIALT